MSPVSFSVSVSLVDTVHSNPQLLMESSGGQSQRYHDSPASETSILVPVLNSQTSLVHGDGLFPVRLVFVLVQLVLV